MFSAHVRIFVSVERVDLRIYAESRIMQSCSELASARPRKRREPRRIIMGSLETGATTRAACPAPGTSPVGA